MTEKSFPRYFWIVFAFAGDSTMTRLLAINMNSVRNLRAQSKSEISKDYNNFFCKSVLSFMYYYVIEIL